MGYWRDFMTEPEYKRVLLDVHFYHAFLPHDQKLAWQGHLAELAEQTELFHSVSNERRLIVGEWSAVLPPRALCAAPLESTDNVTFHCPRNAALGATELHTRKQEWLRREIEMIKRVPFYASFFWTYKKEGAPDDLWSFRTLVGDGTWPRVLDTTAPATARAVEAAVDATVPTGEVHTRVRTPG